MFYVVYNSETVVVGQEYYCYDQLACDGEKIVTLSGEMLVTKGYCCSNMTGVSWGGVDGNCEPCAETPTVTTTNLPPCVSGKCPAQKVLTL